MLIFQCLQMSLASLATMGFRRWVDAGEKKLANNTDEQESGHEQVVDAKSTSV